MKKKTIYNYIFIIFLLLTSYCGGNDKHTGVLHIDDPTMTLDKEYKDKINSVYSDNDVIKEDLGLLIKYVNEQNEEKINLQKKIIYKKIDYLDLKKNFEALLSNKGGIDKEVKIKLETIIKKMELYKLRDIDINKEYKKVEQEYNKYKQKITDLKNNIR